MDNFILQVLGALGGGAAIVAVLAAWLSKLWAARILQSENAEHQQRLRALEAELRRDVDSHLAQLQAELRRDVDTHLAQLQSQLAMLKEKTLKAHTDKLACYADAIECTARLMSDISALVVSRKGAKTFEEAFAEFDVARIHAYGHMALVAPQAVMDAFDRLVDHLLDVNEGLAEADWMKARRLVLGWLNAARADLGVDATPINYNGER